MSKFRSTIIPPWGIAYKVVYKDPQKFGSLWSASACVRDSACAIHYPTDGRIVVPKVGKLFVFESQNQAVDTYLCVDQPYLELWEVEAYGLEPVKFRLLLEYLTDKNVVKRFWSCPNKWSEESVDVIDGVKSCSSLRMLRKLQ